MSDKSQIEKYSLKPILRPVPNGGGEYSADVPHMMNSIGLQNLGLMPEFLSLGFSPDQWRVIENPSHQAECFKLLGKLLLVFTDLKILKNFAF